MLNFSGHEVLCSSKWEKMQKMMGNSNPLHIRCVLLRLTWHLHTSFSRIVRCLQVAGHFTADNLPTIMQTSDGNVLKPLVHDSKGAREHAFYQCVEEARRHMARISKKSDSVSKLQDNDHTNACWTGHIPQIDKDTIDSVIRVKGSLVLAIKLLAGIVPNIPRYCASPVFFPSMPTTWQHLHALALIAMHVWFSAEHVASLQTA